MIDEIKSETVVNAVKKAFSTRGKTKGMLKKSCPPSNTLEAAVWQALQPNPYKLSIGMQFFFTHEQRLVFDLIRHLFPDGAGKDWDMEQLKSLGAW